MCPRHAYLVRSFDAPTTAIVVRISLTKLNTHHTKKKAANPKCFEEDGNDQEEEHDELDKHPHQHGATIHIMET